jgi:DNA-binding response OmpR family regulator
MPRLDGIEVLKRLRSSARRSDLPVLILTALASPSDVQRASAAGANGYLRKPFTPAELTARVLRLLEAPAGPR